MVRRRPLNFVHYSDRSVAETNPSSATMYSNYGHQSPYRNPYPYPYQQAFPAPAFYRDTYGLDNGVS